MTCLWQAIIILNVPISNHFTQNFFLTSSIIQILSLIEKYIKLNWFRNRLKGFPWVFPFVCFFLWHMPLASLLEITLFFWTTLWILYGHVILFTFSLWNRISFHKMTFPEDTSRRFIALFKNRNWNNCFFEVYTKTNYRYPFRQYYYVKYSSHKVLTGTNIICLLGRKIAVE